MKTGRIMNRKSASDTPWNALIIILVSIFSSFAYNQNRNSFIPNYSFSSKTVQSKGLDIIQDAEWLLLLVTPKWLTIFDGVNSGDGQN